jgi:SM-20-related protein
MKNSFNTLESSPELFRVRNFLSPEDCLEFSQHFHQAHRYSATVSNPLGLNLVDERTRRTQSVILSSAITEFFKKRFLALMPELKQHFDTRLDNLQTPQFLRYKRGDFFRPHQDSSNYSGHGIGLRSRSVSAVLFLNSQSKFPEPECFCGGELCLYFPHRLPEPLLRIRAEAGLLVAFRSSVIHEVRPVTHGERYNVVAWYVDDSINELK